MVPVKESRDPGDYLEAMYKTSRKKEWTRFGYSKSADTKMVGRLPCHIDDFSTFEYNKKTDYLTFQTFTSASWNIYDSGNKSVKSSLGAKTTNGTTTFKRSKLRPGKYKLVCIGGEQTMEIEIIL